MYGILFGWLAIYDPYLCETNNNERAELRLMALR
jgi:hypothetical protein